MRCIKNVPVLSTRYEVLLVILVSLFCSPLVNALQYQENFAGELTYHLELRPRSGGANSQIDH